jgi:hypothetical protein
VRDVFTSTAYVFPSHCRVCWRGDKREHRRGHFRICKTFRQFLLKTINN